MIHFFNPGHEAAVLNASKYYMAPANVVTMQRDLSFLPAWYAGADDWILVAENLPEEFVSHVGEFSAVLPKHITGADIPAHKNELLNQGLCFWGITPQVIHFFDTINTEYQLNWDIPEWREEYKSLNSRATAKKCLGFILEKSTAFAEDLLPRFFHSLEDIEDYVGRNSSIRLLAKAPYSSSGRGLLWLPEGKLTRTEQQILHGYLKKQGTVSIEKVLDKKLDFAMEFTTANNTAKFEGLSLFQTNEKGAYLGNFIGSQKQIEAEIARFIPLSQLEEVKEMLILFIAENIAPLYAGCVGVDMLVYEENNCFYLQPCVEINLRNNMGFLTLSLSKNILAEASTGSFHIDFNATPGELYAKHTQRIKSHPLLVENGKIKSGYLSLCPVREDTRYLAYVLID
ncbi:hypothetical protein [Viscerimonas tarda]